MTEYNRGLIKFDEVANDIVWPTARGDGFAVAQVKSVGDIVSSDIVFSPQLGLGVVEHLYSDSCVVAFSDKNLAFNFVKNHDLTSNKMGSVTYDNSMFHDYPIYSVELMSQRFDVVSYVVILQDLVRAWDTYYLTNYVNGSGQVF